MMESQNSSTQYSTEDLSKIVRTMGEMLDRMFAKIKALTQEVMDQETRHKNGNYQRVVQIIQKQNAKIAKPARGSDTKSSL